MTPQDGLPIAWGGFRDTDEGHLRATVLVGAERPTRVSVLVNVDGVVLDMQTPFAPAGGTTGDRELDARVLDMVSKRLLVAQDAGAYNRAVRQRFGVHRDRSIPRGYR